MKSTVTPRFLRACYRQSVDTTPVWLMRQAGRYMAEYRLLRETYSMLEMIKTLALACEVTLHPIQAFDMDAAIIFADILPPLEAIGLHLEFIKGEGPLIHNPIRSASDVEALVVPDPEDQLGFALEAITLTRRELDGRGIPLLGFSGAPFTLAAYALEGVPVATFYTPKSADGRASHLASADYRTYVLPYSRRVIALAGAAGVPVIHFSTGTTGWLELIQEAGGDVISIDWRIDLGSTWRRLRAGSALQGNLDPVALQATWPALKQRATAVLDQAAGRRGHIFNLGHGILPGTPVDNVRRLVDFVHEYHPA